MPFTPRAYCELKEDGREFCGTIRDISMKSIYISVESAHEMDGTCDIQIVLEGSHSELEINNLTGEIIRTDDDGVAIRFDKQLEWFAIVPVYFKKITDNTQL